MAWNMEDYPASMKNLMPLVQKKAIAIGNALLEEGYPEERAIPIAISQAEKWYADASEKERNDYEGAPNPQKSDVRQQNKKAPQLLNADVEVKFDEEEWAVISKGAKRASDRFRTKEPAVARAKEIAQNKASKVYVYKQNGELQETFDYSEA